MKSVNKKLLFVLAVTGLLLAVSASAQIYRYYSPGTIWQVTEIRIKSGMDPAYLQYLDTQLKKECEAEIKAKFMKSYKILRTIDDDVTSWNMLILREYPSLAAMEANEEKADAVTRQALGEDDVKMMRGYEDRSKVREVIRERITRELILK
jgi:hypothetical protein